MCVCAHVCTCVGGACVFVWVSGGARVCVHTLLFCVCVCHSFHDHTFFYTRQDLVDKDLLNQLTQVISGTTSLKHLTVHCAYLKWTNVARSLMEGAADSDSLKTLNIIVDPPPDNVAKVKHLSGLTVKVASQGMYPLSGVYIIMSLIISIHTYVHTYTHIHTCIHTLILCIHKYVRTCSHKYIHTVYKYILYV